MGGLGDITFADIARALGRYRPVAFTVLAIVLLLAVLPNHHRSSSLQSLARAASVTGGGALRASAGGAAPAAGTEVAGASADSAALGASSGGSIGSGGTIGSGARLGSGGGSYVAVPSGSSNPGSGSPSSSGSTYTYAPPSAGPSSDGSDTSGSPGSNSVAASTDDGAPLSIAAASWSSAEGGGTPVASAGVPATDLPVGKRLNADDKHTFLRLSGGSTLLTLKVDAAGTRAPVSGDAAILACQVTTADWKETLGSSFADEPKYDPGKCVAGKPSSDAKAWSFDLSGFASPTDNRGIALVPAPKSAVDFQVTFAR